MDHNKKESKEGLLNGQSTKKSYGSIYNLLPSETESALASDTYREADYCKLDDDDKPNTTSFQNSNSSNDRDYSSYKPIQNDMPEPTSLEEISPSLTQSVYIKSTNDKLDGPEMTLEQCQFCQKSVMISKSADKFRCCYCKNVNDKNSKPKPLIQKLFICGGCKRTVSYLPVSNYVKCACGTVNFVPDNNIKSPFQTTQNLNMYSSSNIYQSQNLQSTQNPYMYQQQQQIQQLYLKQQEELKKQELKKQEELKKQILEQQKIE